MLPKPRTSTLFPYTTLFRSVGLTLEHPRISLVIEIMAIRTILHYPDPRLREKAKPVEAITPEIVKLIDDMAETMYAARSEEHTSELQSQSNLVCRLLLEKKK